MYMSESQFSVLTTYANPVEASALCSWLEAGNIPCIVQQSEHHSGLPMGSDILEVQVLVAPRDPPNEPLAPALFHDVRLLGFTFAPGIVYALYLLLQ